MWEWASLSVKTLEFPTFHWAPRLESWGKVMVGGLCCCVVALRILRGCTVCKAAAMATPLGLLLTSGLARCEVALQGCGTIPVCFFFTIATVFQLYHGDARLYEMRRRKADPTLLPTQGIFNLPHHIGMVWDDAVSYTQWGNGLRYSWMLCSWGEMLKSVSWCGERTVGWLLEVYVLATSKVRS